VQIQASILNVSDVIWLTGEKVAAVVSFLAVGILQLIEGALKEQ
jgi:hypothetical protein